MVQQWRAGGELECGAGRSFGGRRPGLPDGEGAAGARSNRLARARLLAEREGERGKGEKGKAERRREKERQAAGELVLRC